jgi:hypothetical protein
MSKQSNPPDAAGSAQQSQAKAGPLFPPTTLDEVYGCLKWEGPSISLEDMDTAITAEVLERDARSRS